MLKAPEVAGDIRLAMLLQFCKHPEPEGEKLRKTSGKKFAPLKIHHI